jgi:hypothetical protein
MWWEVETLKGTKQKLNGILEKEGTFRIPILSP